MANEKKSSSKTRKRLSSGSNLLISLIVSVILILIAGVTGFMALEGYGFIDALFMTVITITTVGYGEVRPLDQAGRVFTVLLISVSFIVLAVVATYFSRMLFEGGLVEAVRRRRLEKKVKKLKNHYIVCGYGRMGRTIVSALLAEGYDVAVIEKGEQPPEERDENFVFINGDATEEETLRRAGIETANGIVATVASDTENVFITLTARGMRPDIFIMARAAEESSERKMLRAGASKVVNPYSIGGQRMSQAILRPNVVDFIEIGSGGGSLELQLEEIRVEPDMAMAGRTLRDSGIRTAVGLMIIAIKKKGTKMIFNPPPDTKIEQGDILIVLGNVDDFAKLRNILQTAPPANA